MRAQTESAARRISELLEGKDATAVRVGIKARGCNGLSYTMNYATEKAKLEEEVEAHGVRVLVEARAVMHIVGTTMDYVEDDLTSEFVFHNPNAEAACGCGESFTVAKNPEAEGRERGGGGRMTRGLVAGLTPRRHCLQFYRPKTYCKGASSRAARAPRHHGVRTWRSSHGAA